MMSDQTADQFAERIKEVTRDFEEFEEMKRAKMHMCAR